MFKILSTNFCWKKKYIYIKCNIWRVAVRPSYIWDARFLKVKIYPAWLFITNGRQRNAANAQAWENWKGLELWWQLYITWLPVRDLENCRPLDFCWTEGTSCWTEGTSCWTEGTSCWIECTSCWPADKIRCSKCESTRTASFSTGVSSAVIPGNFSGTAVVRDV